MMSDRSAVTSFEVSYYVVLLFTYVLLKYSVCYLRLFFPLQISLSLELDPNLGRATRIWHSCLLFSKGPVTFCTSGPTRPQLPQANGEL